MTRITQTPVRSSPAMIARSIGAAPRQRGSSEGCTLSIGHPESSGSRISWPKAQTASASGRTARIRSRASSSLTFAACEQLDPQLGGDLRGRRRLSAAAAPPGPVGRGDDEQRAVLGAGEPAQHRAGELRGAEVDGPHAFGAWLAVLAGLFGGLLLGQRRAVALALAQGAQGALALRPRGAVEDQHPVEVVDLVLEDARLKAGGLDPHRLAVGVETAEAGVKGALDVHRDPGQAQAALLGDHDLVGEPLDLGVDQRASARCRPPPGRPAAGAAPRPGWRRGRRPSRRA